MTDDETLALLTWAALIDPRLKRVDPAEAADRAQAWAELLADVDLEAAKAAVKAHYTAPGVDAILPGDILARVGVVEDPWAHLPDITPQLIAEDRRRVLYAAGVTEAEWEARKHDPVWIRATFPARELEADPVERERWL